MLFLSSSTILLTLFQLSYAYNVFIFSAPIGFSHIQLTTKVADTLVDAGYNVTVLLPVLERNSVKYASKKANVIFEQVPEEMMERHENRANNFWKVGPLLDNLMAIRSVADIQKDLCEYLLRNGTFRHLVSPNIDLAISDMGGYCGWGIAEVLNIKYRLAISATGFIDAVSPHFDTPVVYSYLPGTLLPYTDIMTFPLRMFSFMWQMVSRHGYRLTVTEKYEEIFARNNIDFDLETTARTKMNYFLVNSNPMLDIARPVSGKIKYIGGIAVSSPAKMPIEFEKYLQSSCKGFIVISFGSYAPTSKMPSIMKQAVLAAIDGLPDYNFIWKTDKQDIKLADNRTNLKTSLWIPQRELLNDARVKLFVSHAGMNSVLETAQVGMPSVLVPIFGDQFQNAAVMARKNTSTVVWKSDLKNDSLLESMKQMLGDSSYVTRARRLAGLVRTSSAKAKRELLEAVELTCRFGKITDLDVASHHLSFIQYYSIDVIFTLSLITIIIIFIIFKTSSLTLSIFSYISSFSPLSTPSSKQKTN